MRIGIEAQRIFRKKKHGMDLVALELIRCLRELDKVNEYVVFVHPDQDRQILKASDNLKIVELAGGFYPLWEQVILPDAVRKAGCDLLHCTSNTAPLCCKVPLIVTLHDIIYMEKGYADILKGNGTWYQKTGNVYRRFVVPRILGNSRKIITVSEFEKTRIASFFSLNDDSKLVAVHNGVGDHFRPVTDNAELLRIREKYSLPEKFFFFLGNTDPKKNTAGTLKAFSEFIRQSGSNIKLLMIDFGQYELEKMLRSAGAADIADRIVLTGYINNQDLPAIYSQSEAFLYPSLRESFGLPILEAMACGAPVITSNTSSMPEVAGDAAFMVDPYDPAEITGAMLKLSSGTSPGKLLSEKGRLRAAGFSWMAMASKVLEIYEEVANQPNP